MKKHFQNYDDLLEYIDKLDDDGYTCHKAVNNINVLTHPEKPTLYVDHRGYLRTVTDEKLI